MQYWPFDDEFSFRPTGDSTGGPLDQTAAFQPDTGPDITRRRTTARVEAWQLGVILPALSRLPVFEQWFDSNLQGGVLPFSWRHPSTRAVRRFQFSPRTYSVGYLGGDWVRLSFSCQILPGVPWFAPYVPDNSARVPDWVADYAAGKYWVAGAEVAATGLAAVSGTYVVQDRLGPHTTVKRLTTYAGNVPQTAPAGVTWSAGFLSGGAVWSGDPECAA
jgi:hypothetical protein